MFDLSRRAEVAQWLLLNTMIAKHLCAAMCSLCWRFS
jgi:hypothetical protein